MKKLLPLLLFTSLVLQHCKTTAKQQNEPKPLFTLFRTACFGTCPSYTLEVFANKKVVFNGLTHTTPLGKQNFTISTKELNALKKKFEQLSIDGYADFYPLDAPVPQDIPSIIISSNINGKEKRTEIKGGKAPEAIQEWIEALEKLKMSVLSKSKATDTK